MYYKIIKYLNIDVTCKAEEREAKKKIVIKRDMQAYGIDKETIMDRPFRIICARPK